MCWLWIYDCLLCWFPVCLACSCSIVLITAFCVHCSLHFISPSLFLVHVFAVFRFSIFIIVIACSFVSSNIASHTRFACVCLCVPLLTFMVFGMLFTNCLRPYGLHGSLLHAPVDILDDFSGFSRSVYDLSVHVLLFIFNVFFFHNPFVRSLSIYPSSFLSCSPMHVSFSSVFFAGWGWILYDMFWAGHGKNPALDKKKRERYIYIYIDI